ncbi:hypothetical protein [uncultured Weeksella sp.]|uniref:hypothetical protein n=1 Tax=uncultured Weeksella sp. TaxID=1161389 RepID=UPI00259BAF55|nr:hypothetical protein [uncultured Weeksella sp.]
MGLETQIYKRLLKCGFKNHKSEHNKRLGILRTLITDDGKYIEIYKERDCWYSIFFYGISSRYLPLNVDLIDDSDLLYLEKFLTEHFNYDFA